MPYIEPESRLELDPTIDELIRRIRSLAERSDPGGYAGLLNYTCTRLALGAMPEVRYSTIATVSGVFQNVISEFYRRVAVPYEDGKREANGDVFGLAGLPHVH